VLPLLEDVLQGGVVEALARTAELLRDDLAALDEWAAAEFQVINSPVTGLQPGNERVDHEKRGELEVAALESLPRAIRTRVLRAWATQAGAEPLTADRTGALDALITDWHGQGPIDLPGGVCVRRTSGRLQAYRDSTGE
jgi:tRNA(Ile)-lysidine synthase